MDINVTGRKMNVGDALTTYVGERLETVTEKYFSRSIDAKTIFAKEGHLCRVDLSLHANQGINMQSRGESEDPYAAFEVAAEKIEKQLRRYKRRLKNHHNAASAREAAVELARETVIAPEADNDVGDDQPIIIAESVKHIPNISVGDAAMLMDLADTNTFMFRNIKTGLVEVVHKREDGNIGWIAPSEQG